MTTRKRPPNRRPTLTQKLRWSTETGQHVFDISISPDLETGAPIEVFYADGQKQGSQLQHTIQDACVLISLLLQHGAEPRAIAKSLSTSPVYGENQPATVIGVIADAVEKGVLET